jgi:hypothetical protein
MKTGRLRTRDTTRRIKPITEMCQYFGGELEFTIRPYYNRIKREGRIIETIEIQGVWFRRLAYSSPLYLTLHSSDTNESIEERLMETMSDNAYHIHSMWMKLVKRGDSYIDNGRYRWNQPVFEWK